MNTPICFFFLLHMRSLPFVVLSHCFPQNLHKRKRPFVHKKCTQKVLFNNRYPAPVPKDVLTKTWDMQCIQLLPLWCLNCTINPVLSQSFPMAMAVILTESKHPKTIVPRLICSPPYAESRFRLTLPLSEGIPAACRKFSTMAGINILHSRRITILLQQAST